MFSSIVLGELMFGFRRGSRYEKSLSELDAFLRHPAVRMQEVGWVTVDRFGRIAATVVG